MSEWVSSIVGTGYEANTSLPPGFSGVQLVPEEGLVTFAWKGEVPNNIASRIASPPAGVTSQTIQGAFTREELVKAREQLVVATPKLDSEGSNWTQIGLLSDGSGLTVGVTPKSTESLQGLENQYTAEAGVPVQMKEETPNIPSGGQRWNRVAPWAGGIGLRTPSGGRCSSAFTGMSGGKSVMLSAYHCGGNGTYNAGRLSGVGPVLGPVWAGKRQRDTIIITTAEGRGRVMDGAWNAPASSYRKVARANYNFNGQLVCTDGAATGGHCDVRIDNDNTSFRWADGTVVSPAIYVTGGLVWGKGDSGGPAWAFFDDARVKVEARGVLASVNGSGYQCPSSAFTTSCYRAGHYVPIMTALGDYALTLRTE